MFIVTNREILEKKKGFAQLGGSPNPLGNLELRIVEVSGQPGKWKVKVLSNDADEKMRTDAGLPKTGKHFASDYAARILLKKLQKKTQRRNVLFFVHGFNNDVKSVVERAYFLEKNYNVEVVAFSWPANGGGVSGVASYKSDKRDALASTGALDRCIQRLGEFMRAFNQEAYDRVISAADKKYRFDAERREQYIATMMEKNCPFKISMLLHSMGNYLFKHLLLSSIYHARDLVFDNVILASADANNEAHRKWVDQIQCRNRVYITINEDDSALKAARMKLGSKQRARLGHYVSRLDSDHAVYVDFTDMKGVGKSHAYFEGKALGNTKIQEFFRAAIHGDRAEKKLKFDASMNLYRI